MGITNETRAEAYAEVKPKIPTRADMILSLLTGRDATASELALDLMEAGVVQYLNRGYVAPRLTELKEEGKVEVVGRRKSIISNATEAVWRRTDEDVIWRTAQ